MADTVQDIYLNGDRTSELWQAFLVKLAEKADLGDLSNYTTPEAVATAITTALSTYSDTAAVTTMIANALVDYMTESEINDAIAQAIVDAAGIKFKKVTELPQNGEVNTIYLVPREPVENNIYDEYMWIDNAWEIMGTTAIDLTNYWSKDELRAMTAAELQAILT